MAVSVKEPYDINTPHRVCMRRIYNALMTYEGGVIDIPDKDGYELLQYFRHGFFIPQHIELTSELLSSMHIYYWMVGETRGGKIPLSEYVLRKVNFIQDEKVVKALNLFKLKYPRASEIVNINDFNVKLFNAREQILNISFTSS